MNRDPQKDPHSLTKLEYHLCNSDQIIYQGLAKSPKLKNVNIINQLNMSYRQSVKTNKVTYPSNKTQITQSLLNIQNEK